MLGMCGFLILSLCLYVSIKIGIGIFFSLLPQVPPPTFTRAAIFPIFSLFIILLVEPQYNNQFNNANAVLDSRLQFYF
jgi:hypothetical protein